MIILLFNLLMFSLSTIAMEDDEPRHYSMPSAPIKKRLVQDQNPLSKRRLFNENKNENKEDKPIRRNLFGNMTGNPENNNLWDNFTHNTKPKNIEASNSIKRHLPPGLTDNINYKPGDVLFDDNEIILIYNRVDYNNNELSLLNHITISHQERDLTLYAQQAAQSCSYTNVASVIKNKYNNHNDIVTTLIHNNKLSDDKERIELLTKYNIPHTHVLILGYKLKNESIKDIINDFPYSHHINIVNKNDDAVLNYIKDNQDNYLFAILTIDDKKIGSHSIIVLRVEDDGVIIFDPLHGWHIKVTKAALLKRINKGYKQDMIWIHK